MGIFKKLGLRKLALNSIELVQLIQLYQLKDGIHLYRQLHNKNPSIEVKLSFLRFPFYLRNNISDKAIFKQVFTEKQYTPEKYPFPEIKTILDGGANIGMASIYFFETFPNSEILAVEPETANFKLLQENTKHYKSIECFQGALWSKNEELHIKNPDSLAASFMVDSVVENTTMLKGTTIKSLLELKGWNSIDLLKIDIEGSEKEVFEGDTEWLKKVKLLIVELHDRYKEGCTKAVFKALENYDYEAYFHHENIFIKFN